MQSANATWEQFVEGPLSPACGGTQSLYDVARALRQQVGDDPDGEELPRGLRSFVLKGGDAAPQLFDYQEEIVHALLAWHDHDAGQQGSSVMVSLPTGGGKTRTAICFLHRLLKAQLHSITRAVWVAPSIELINQAIETLQAIWSQVPGSPVVRVYVNELARGGVSRRDQLPELFFLTTQLAAKRLSALRDVDPQLLIFDEAHQAVARTFAAIVRNGVLAGGRVVGLTATPGRMSDVEGQDLADLFKSPLITAPSLGSNPVKSLRDRGVLAKVLFRQISLPSEWNTLRVSSTAGRSLTSQQLAVNRHRFWATVEAIAGLPKGHKTLVFGASVPHCQAIELALRERGVACGTVFHTHADGARRLVLEKFSKGEIGVLINKGLLTTGYDCKAVTDVVLATPIRSAVMWEQIVGRVSRGPAVGGTDTGQVWELDDHRKMHGELLSYARYLGDLWN